MFTGHGYWNLPDCGRLNLKGAGAGIDEINGAVSGIMHDSLLIDEDPTFFGEKIKLVWHLKKIFSNSEASALFSKEKNYWRK